MKSIPVMLLVSTLFSSVLLAHSATEPSMPSAAPLPVILTPAQTDHILKELEKVEEQIGKGRGGLFATAMAKFRDAMVSDNAALSLYLDCYRLAHFDRKDLRGSDFMDWRDRNEGRLKDDEFKKSLLLQLEYLMLSIQAQDASNTKQMGSLVTSLQAFMVKAVTAVQGSTRHSSSGAVSAKDSNKGGGRKGGGGGGGGPDVVGTLRQDVSDCEFANAYMLKDFFKREEWEYVPMNVGGIYKKVIFPYYLSEKKEELATQWEARVNTEVALRKALMSETEFNVYFKENGPRLQWERYNYLVRNNVTAVNALAELLKVIQNNPSHPDADAWLKEFRELVSQVSQPGLGPAPVEKPIAPPQ